MNIDVLIVGSGAREHAIGWKIAQSSRVGKIYFAPGNGGTDKLGENVALSATDIKGLAAFAHDKKIGLTVASSEETLALGIVDTFTKMRLRIFGPTKAAARIESSKAYAKQIMREARIPCAESRTFTDYSQAREYIHVKHAPIVIKASGLAYGKGVYVCSTIEEAEAALVTLMVDREYGESGAEVVIEEFLEGVEVSIHAVCDGINYSIFPAAQDHKRIGEGDTGKNTGGMGVICPIPWLSSAIMMEIERGIVQPLLRALADKGTPFHGVLYPGIMITSTGPRLLEVNARFGDPEAQAYMRLYDSDLLDLLEASIDGTVGNIQPRWRIGGVANVVLASAGYPDDFVQGLPISGLEVAEASNNVVVFHGATTHTDTIRTAGGRVLSVTATGSPLARALELAYAAADKIQFDGKYMRRDIGRKSLV